MNLRTMESLVPRRSSPLEKRRSRRRKQPLVSDVFIDKITLTADLNEIEATTLLNSLSECGECRRSYSQMNGYFHTYRIVLDTSTRDSLLIQFSRWRDNTSFRCEFNPGNGNYIYAENCLETLFPGGYYELLARCYVTRIDLTVDILGKHMENLLVRLPRMQINRLFAGKRGLEEIESIYIGNPRSARHFLMYDRTKYLKKKNRENDTRFIIPSRDTTRLEFRIKSACTFRELQNETINPFIDLEIFDLNLLTKYGTELRVFLDSCRFRGCNASLALMRPRERKRYLSLLPPELKPRWWKPDRVWENWPDVLAQLTPSEDSLIGM